MIDLIVLKTTTKQDIRDWASSQGLDPTGVLSGPASRRVRHGTRLSGRDGKAIVRQDQSYFRNWGTYLDN